MEIKSILIKVTIADMTDPEGGDIVNIVVIVLADADGSPVKLLLSD